MAWATESGRSGAPSQVSGSANRLYQVNLATFGTSALIVTLPVQALPLIGKLPTPLANPIILLVVIGYLIALLCRPHQIWNLKYPFQTHLIVLFAYCCASVIYGQIGLSARNLSVLRLTTGALDYVPVAAQRLIQLLFAFGALEIVRRSKLSAVQLTQTWLAGTVIFATIHLAIVIVVGSEVGRPGTFSEGNFGGLYYIFSIFLALEFRRRQPRTMGFVFLCAAILGLVLSRSSASFVAFGVAVLARQILTHRPTISQKIKQVFGTVIVISLPVTLVLSGNDFGLTAKLLTQEVTPDSFSRIDRLLSIVTALDIFTDAPIFGSGIQSFGFIANTYLADGPFEAMYDYSFRRIPNNVYVEIASDLGIVGILLFVGLIARITYSVYRSEQDGRRNILACLIGMLIYYLAFPTYTMIYVWAFLGLALHYVSQPVGQTTSRIGTSVNA